MQQVRIDGVRAAVLERMAPLVGLPADTRDPLPVVIGLLQKVRGLPPYVRQTTELSPEASAVREALLRASEPVTLLFEDLPDACGVAPFLGTASHEDGDVTRFLDRLQQALRAITGAYDALMGTIAEDVAAAFHLRATDPEERRHELATRAQAVLRGVSSPDMKALLVRLTNEVIDTQAWYESMAALLAGRPPVKWRDDDLGTFRSALREQARRFTHLEAVAFDASAEDVDGAAAPEVEAAPSGVALRRTRVSVTLPDGSDREVVASYRPEDEDDVARLVQVLEEAVAAAEDLPHTDVALVAVGRLIQRLSEQRESTLDATLTAKINGRS
jgi:hypothetical protein